MLPAEGPANVISKLKPVAFSVAYFVAVILLAHFFAPPGYR